MNVALGLFVQDVATLALFVAARAKYPGAAVLGVYVYALALVSDFVALGVLIGGAS